MKILVYGAGVIGSYLAHVLCQSGNEVTLLARGEWKQVLEEKGLTIWHHLQRKMTLDHPRIIGQIDFSEHYDAVFSVMSYHQVGAVLDDLAALNARVVILVGNNLSAIKTEQYIRTRSKAEKHILFGFQVTAGKRERDRVICERLGAGMMDIGFLDKPVPEGLKRTLEQLFRNSSYKLRWHDSMESFLKCHAASILPLGYLAYGADCDFKRTTKAQRRASMAASAEGYDLLLKLGYTIVPKGNDAYFRPGPQKLLMSLLLFAMSHTVIGELVATAHCRHAVSEMEMLDKAWATLQAEQPDHAMPRWNALRAAMPEWSALHHLYEKV